MHSNSIPTVHFCGFLSSMNKSLSWCMVLNVFLNIIFQYTCVTFDIEDLNLLGIVDNEGMRGNYGFVKYRLCSIAALVIKCLNLFSLMRYPTTITSITMRISFSSTFYSLHVDIWANAVLFG